MRHLLQAIFPPPRADVWHVPPFVGKLLLVGVAMERCTCAAFNRGTNVFVRNGCTGSIGAGLLLLP